MSLKTTSLYLMGVLYVLAGINHFWHPDWYMRIMPPLLPFPLILIYISGVVEMVLGVTVCIPRFTRLAAWGIMALLIAVFPANIYMALNPDVMPMIPVWVAWLRLPLQGVLVAWAYRYTSNNQ